MMERDIYIIVRTKPGQDYYNGFVMLDCFSTQDAAAKFIEDYVSQQFPYNRWYWRGGCLTIYDDNLNPLFEYYIDTLQFHE